MTRLVIKYFFLLVIIPAALLAQATENEKKASIFNEDRPQSNLSATRSSKEISLMKDSDAGKVEEIKSVLVKERHFFKPQRNNTKEKSPFSIVASFRKNVRFGGFWNKYAIINFTPSVLLKPNDFVDIYANHNYSCFIPIEGIKEHFKMLCIQGVSILAVDNAVKFIFGSDKMIPSIAGFALKTIIINSVMSTINKGKKHKIFDNKYYYYSVSIRF
jgi:hypothetical protein